MCLVFSFDFGIKEEKNLGQEDEKNLKMRVCLKMVIHCTLAPYLQRQILVAKLGPSISCLTLQQGKYKFLLC